MYGKAATVLSYVSCSWLVAVAAGESEALFDTGSIKMADSVW